MNDIVIEANGMTRYFGGKAAVEQVSFKVRTGEIFAMLGRNGAGKTTLISMMLGFLKPTRGTTTVFGCGSPPRLSAGHSGLGHPGTTHSCLQHPCSV